MDETSDKELMLRVGRQDHAALEELLRRWDRRVLTYLAKVCGDREAAQDLRQEVFIRVYRYGATYNPDYAFTTWLFRIVRNVMSSWRVRQSRTPRAAATGIEEMTLHDPALGPSDKAAQSESVLRVRQAVGQLAPHEQELIVMRMYMNMNYREIAEIMDIPETTIKSRFYVLLGRLRETLGGARLPERN